MRRLLICSLLLAACRFSAPDGEATDGGGGGDDGPRDPDAAPARCDVAPSWEAGLSPIRTIYVAPTSTLPQDGTQQNPYTSLTTALNAAKTAGPGTRVLLAAGTYLNGGASIYDLHGTPMAPIWIEGPATGARGVIDGGVGGLHLSRPEYVVVRHLDIKNMSQAAFNADDAVPGGIAHHLVIDDVKVSTGAGAAFQLTGVDDVTVRDSTATSCGRGVMMVGVHRASVARVAVTSMQSYGAVLTGGSRDIEVRQSRFTSIGNIGVWIGGSSDANEFRPPLTTPTTNLYEVTDVRVFDNVFNDSTAAITCNNCRRALVAHNELRGATQAVFQLRQDRTTTDNIAYAFGRPGEVHWINNVIEAGPATAALQVSAGGGGMTDLGSCEMSHNLWHRLPAAPWTPNLPSPLTEAGGIYDRPSGYNDTGKLCSSGGAVGKGVALPEVTGTLDGACRPTPPSIGPSERDPGC